MKNNIVLRFVVTLVLALSAVMCFAQEIPKATWQFEPTGSEFREWNLKWVATEVLIVWGDYDPHLRARCGLDGSVTNMDLTMQTKDGNVKSFIFPADRHEPNFPNLEAWKVLAQEAWNRCVFISEGMYIDTNRYECVGVSRVLSGSEFGYEREHLVLKDGERLMVVRLLDWKGTVPEKGEMVIVGRHKDFELFFPVEHVKGKYLLEPETAREIAAKGAEREKEMEKYAKEGEKNPILELRPIIVK